MKKTILQSSNNYKANTALIPSKTVYCDVSRANQLPDTGFGNVILFSGWQTQWPHLKTPTSL
jgi:hypothetical protein